MIDGRKLAFQLNELFAGFLFHVGTSGRSLRLGESRSDSAFGFEHILTRLQAPNWWHDEKQHQYCSGDTAENVAEDFRVFGCPLSLSRLRRLRSFSFCGRRRGACIKGAHDLMRSVDDSLRHVPSFEARKNGVVVNLIGTTVSEDRASARRGFDPHLAFFRSDEENDAVVLATLSNTPFLCESSRVVFDALVIEPRHCDDGDLDRGLLLERCQLVVQRRPLLTSEQIGEVVHMAGCFRVLLCVGRCCRNKQQHNDKNCVTGRLHSVLLFGCECSVFEPNTAQLVPRYPSIFRRVYQW